MLCKMKISTEKRNQEYGIRQRRTLSGKKMLKIKCQKTKKVKKPIMNGKRNLNFPFLKLDRTKTKKRLTLPDKTGACAENSDMDGETKKKLAQKVQD